MPRSRAAISIAVFLFLTDPALAHDAFGNVAPFWSGALHILVSPLSMATIVATSAVLVSVDYATAERCGLWVIASAALATLTGDTFSALAPAGAGVVGSLAAADIKPGGLALRILSVIAGAAIAVGAKVDNPGIIASGGVVVAVFAGLYGTLLIFEALESRFPLARRIVGAWVAAIGLLLGALALRT